ncbi:hypothetical protein BDY17DRAFT_291926 [Neohortaea acidophila]|uniref:Uncharacterized protein n=1 Tax=Neohortaea acidophila TaxID=245834 RepID=A0A6A6Q2C6_9PEZI|nr:uncharacterized protein BDY17DRAFT_291926 [Neohortaea acidophila]KAF2486678.1 hypothetical protein BDY17DRAFT_291926 [Neohortaea acidophila]
MALKRKRSSATLSSPFSDTTTISSDASSPGGLPFFYTQSKPTEPLYQKPTWSFPTYDSDSSYSAPSRHLNSRTRKRHRDDRPDEESVFASTLSRLYEAQRSLPKHEPAPSAPSRMVVDEEPVQRSTLHSFWKIEGAAPVPPTTHMAIDSGGSAPINPEMRCEDCDGTLRRDDVMDLDDGIVELETSCVSCRRHVCDACAVLGNERVCLACVSRSGR